ncbi:AIS_collapsed_G0005180.mRNA.1.CDS.1 [Saccharomyces cerevisiae]|nr:AIS_collapsed_G0005180.mRNA.1.CDS.1 [Saccharomyces cerevisiae]
MKIFWDPRSVIEHQDYSGPANVFHLLFTSLPTMSAETAAANTATAPVPEVQEQESSKSKQVNLTPAPLPTSSPWKLAPTEIPVSTISIEDLDATRKKKNRTPTPKSSTATKWVPIKASITVSGTKRSGSKNGASNGNSNKSKNNKTAASSTSSSNANRKKKHHQHNAKKQQQMKKDGFESAVGEEDSKDATSQENGQSTQKQQPPHHRNHHHSHHHNSNGPQRRKFHNSNNAGMPQNQGFPPQFKPYQGRNARNNNNNRSKYHNHFHHNQQHPQQPMVKLQQQFYPVQPVLMAINNIARQIEYYFSEENLTVDNYLRSKLSKDGFAPLSLISKFYRVVNMSFGGDTNLILAALREIVANEAATVNVAEGTLAAKEGDNVTGEAKEPSPLDKYFVRSKSWSNWLPETFETEINIEKELVGDALDQFMISLPPVPQQEEESSTELASQEQETKEDSAPVAAGESESSL